MTPTSINLKTGIFYTNLSQHIRRCGIDLISIETVTDGDGRNLLEKSKGQFNYIFYGRMTWLSMWKRAACYFSQYNGTVYPLLFSRRDGKEMENLNTLNLHASFLGRIVRAEKSKSCFFSIQMWKNRKNLYTVRVLLILHVSFDYFTWKQTRLERVEEKYNSTHFALLVKRAIQGWNKLTQLSIQFALSVEY